MISLPAAVRVYLYTAPCDMRRGFDGLRTLARHVVGVNPLAGHLARVLQPAPRPGQVSLLGSRRLARFGSSGWRRARRRFRSKLRGGRRSSRAS